MSKKLTNNKSSKKSPVHAPSAQELEQLESVLQLMKRYGVNVLDVENDQGRIHLQIGTGGGGVASQAAHVMPAPVVTTTAQAPSGASVRDTKAQASGLSANQKEIKSPFVGTFYRSASPTSEPYCREGQSIKKGQTLCIVEAMKLMNEIESEFNGKVISILVENGQPVEFGEPLFIIET